MAVEELGRGSQGGYRWMVDHDDVAGAIGVTVTDGGSPQPGVLQLHAEIYSEPGNVLVDTINPIRIDPFDNQGRRVLYTNARLVGVTLLVPRGQTPPIGLVIWTSFTPG